ncbi:alpha/beta hydrolase [Streptomyces sp. NPDC006529]|uniref:alpha/beta fold hydrolase n=1 Tax=Streptomyces sp. NPDC006529 TaxID=3157177 RepID=UPI0033B65BDB
MEAARTAHDIAYDIAHDIAYEAFRAAYDDALGRWPGPGPVDARVIDTPFGATRINSTGPRDAPPLALLPGGGTTSLVWGECLRAGLARERRVHAVDLVGEPGMSVPAAGRPLRTVDDLTEWLDAVLDGVVDGVLDGQGVGGGVVELAGYSYGGWIAAHYAARRPERLRRLVLLDPTQVFAGLRPAYVARALPMLLRPTPDRVRSFLAWETGGAVLDPAWMRVRTAAAALPTARPVTGARPVLGAGEARGLPLLALFAGNARCHDPARAARAATAAVPDAVVRVLPGVSHHSLLLVGAGEVVGGWG